MNILPPPGPQRRRQLILLGVCLVGLAVVLMRYWPADEQAAAPRPASNPQAGQGTAGTPVLSLLPEPLKLDALQPVPDAPEVGRNPFRFGVRPPPPQPPPPPPQPQLPPPPQLPPQPVGPPPIPLEVVGMISMPDGRMLVSLKDSKTGAVFEAFEGQIVDGRFRVAKVGMQSVVVTHLDGSNARTLVAR